MDVSSGSDEDLSFSLVYSFSLKHEIHLFVQATSEQWRNKAGGEGALRPGHQVSDPGVGHQIQSRDMVKSSKKSQNREKFFPFQYYFIE